MSSREGDRTNAEQQGRDVPSTRRGGGGVQPQRKSENTQERVLKEEGSKFLMVIGTGKGRGQMEHFHLSVRNQETEVMRAWN